MIRGGNLNDGNSWDRGFSDREFQRLVGELLDDEISEQDFARLQSWLQQSEASRNTYMQLAELHVTLHESLANVVQPARREAADDLLARRKPWPIAPLLTVCCVLSVVAVCWFSFSLFNTNTIAWTGSHANAGRELRPGDRFVARPKENAVIFRNGVRISLSIGADLELLNEKLVRLHTGQAYVDVGEHGKGFTVLTEAVDVIDLGTVFGVDANTPGETDVLVFDGVVDIATNKRSQTSREFLVSGQAQRYLKSGGEERISTVWSSTTPHEWSTVSRGGNSLIASVGDNVSLDADAKFYLVVPGGFGEDAKVYVDRNYEWNGIDESGIPAALLGADYIRTFNDDKHREDLGITMVLTRPADVYVLVDERYLVPPWLASDFINTGWQVGIDLGVHYRQGESVAPPLGTLDKRWLGKGPGQSVDVPVNVWKRKSSADQIIHLGANGEKSAQFAGATERAGSMYGIIVVPRPLSDD